MLGSEAPAFLFGQVIHLPRSALHGVYNTPHNKVGTAGSALAAFKVIATAEIVPERTDVREGSRTWLYCLACVEDRPHADSDQCTDEPGVSEQVFLCSSVTRHGTNNRCGRQDIAWRSLVQLFGTPALARVSPLISRRACPGSSNDAPGLSGSLEGFGRCVFYVSVLSACRSVKSGHAYGAHTIRTLRVARS